MFESLFGAEMPLPVRFLIAFLVVLALIGGAAWLLRRFGGNRLGTTSARGRQPRLAVIDNTAVDSRRRLVLVRRDNVEHLLMIGGPTDVVVEANIVRATASRDMRGGNGIETVRPEFPSWQPPAADVPSRPARPVPEDVRPVEPILEAPVRAPRQPEPIAGPAPEPVRPGAPRDPVPLPRDVGPPIVPRDFGAAEPVRDLGSIIGREPGPMTFPRDLSVSPRDLNTPPRDMPAAPREIQPAGRRSGSAGDTPRPGFPRATPVAEPLRAAPPRPPVEEPVATLDLAEPAPPVERIEPAAAVVARVEVEVARASPDPSEPANQDADQNLAEMAQRLEAALRRPGGPSRRDEPAAPIPETVTPLRQTRPERPVAAAAAEPKESRADGKPSAAKSLYESLEQEMASLLGRPAGKP